MRGGDGAGGEGDRRGGAGEGSRGGRVGSCGGGEGSRRGVAGRGGVFGRARFGRGGCGGASGAGFFSISIPLFAPLDLLLSNALFFSVASRDAPRADLRTSFIGSLSSPLTSAIGFGGAIFSATLLLPRGGDGGCDGAGEGARRGGEGLSSLMTVGGAGAAFFGRLGRFLISSRSSLASFFCSLIRCSLAL